MSSLNAINTGRWAGSTGSASEFFGVVESRRLFLIVEADSVSVAIDELAENEKFSHNIVVADDDLGDFAEEDRHYGPSGQVLVLDHLMVHGDEGKKCPFPCRYFGDGLPAEGIEPTEFQQYMEAEEQ